MYWPPAGDENSNHESRSYARPQPCCTPLWATTPLRTLAGIVTTGKLGSALGGGDFSENDPDHQVTYYHRRAKTRTGLGGHLNGKQYKIKTACRLVFSPRPNGTTTVSSILDDFENNRSGLCHQSSGKSKWSSPNSSAKPGASRKLPGWW